MENPPQMLITRFLFKEKPILERSKLLSYFQKYFSKVDSPEESQTLLFFFPEYTAKTEDSKTLPAQCTLFEASEISHDDEKLVSALQQNWEWSEADEIVTNCQYEVVVSDFMSRIFDYKIRTVYFQKCLLALIEALKPDAIHFTSSDKVSNPPQHWENLTNEPPEWLASIFSIRMYNIANGQEGEILMDTLGLHALGLPDFQIIYKGFNPNQVANLLYNYAHYIYEKGAVIEDGNTIAGIMPEDKWTCEYQNSVVSPERTVIHIIPQS